MGNNGNWGTVVRGGIPNCNWEGMVVEGRLDVVGPNRCNRNYFEIIKIDSPFIFLYFKMASSKIFFIKKV